MAHRLNLGCGPHLIDGFDNLNPPEWRFEDGLGDYADGSVEGITCSHTWMMVPLEAWPAAFAEIARVLEPGGIVRFTEDATDDPESERFVGWHDAVTLTSRKLIGKHLRAARLTVVRGIDADTTAFTDRTLIQTHHGPEPKVFHVEGRKP